MLKKLFKNGVIITANEHNDWFSAGYMVVEKGSIREVGGGTPPGETDFDEVIDLHGKWLMPGLVNTHGHAAMSVLRGYADDYPLQVWLEKYIWPMEEKFSAETVRWGGSLAVLEMLKTGTTCFMDMYDHMDTLAQVVEESGIRAVLARGVIGLGSEHIRNMKLAEATQFAKNWHQQAGGRITTMMSPHAPYTCPPDYIRQIVERAEQLDLPVHIHLSETEYEVRLNMEQYGKRPVAYLRDLGVFQRPTLIAHAVHLDEEEMDILKKHDVKISHNPASNLKLGSGVAAVPRLLAKGFHISVGTDSAASNNHLDMFQQLRLAALIHKGVNQDPTVVPARTALAMGTRWGGESLFLAHIGSLENGKAADFIILDPHKAHLQPVHDPISHLIYSAAGHDVTDVYVQGKPVVRNKECLTLDEEKIIAEAKRVVQQLNR